MSNIKEIAGIFGVTGTSGTYNNGTASNILQNQCAYCLQYYNGFSHNCNYSQPLYPYYPYTPYSGGITLGGNYYKPLSSYSLQELLDELKRRKNAQDAKVKELEKEVELQKQLDAMFPESK